MLLAAAEGRAERGGVKLQRFHKNGEKQRPSCSQVVSHGRQSLDVLQSRLEKRAEEEYVQLQKRHELLVYRASSESS